MIKALLLAGADSSALNYPSKKTPLQQKLYTLITTLKTFYGDDADKGFE